MLHIYDVGNTNRSGFWVMARDEEHAIDIALERGHIKKRSSANVHDVHERMLEQANERGSDLQQLLELGRPGQIFQQVKSLSFADVLEQLQSNDDRPTPSRWLVSSNGKIYDAYGNVADNVPELPPLEEDGQIGIAD